MQILKADRGFSYLLFSTFAYLLYICPRSKMSAFRICIIKPKSLVPMVLYHPNIHYFLVKKFSVHQVDTLVNISLQPWDSPTLSWALQGGQDDLLSSHAWEEDGRTGMRFVRAITGGDEADHDIAGNMMIIWAHGQQTSFYQEDQLKYHSKVFRGISVIGK